MRWTHNVLVSGFWLCQCQHSHKRVAFPWQWPKVCDHLVFRNLCMMFFNIFTVDTGRVKEANNRSNCWNNIYKLKTEVKAKCLSHHEYCHHDNKKALTALIDFCYTFLGWKWFRYLDILNLDISWVTGLWHQTHFLFHGLLIIMNNNDSPFLCFLRHLNGYNLNSKKSYDIL